MTLCTVVAEVARNMVRICRPLEIRGMALVTIRVDKLVVTTRMT